MRISSSTVSARSSRSGPARPAVTAAEAGHHRARASQHVLGAGRDVAVVHRHRREPRPRREQQREAAADAEPDDAGRPGAVSAPGQDSRAASSAVNAGPWPARRCTNIPRMQRSQFLPPYRSGARGSRARPGPPPWPGCRRSGRMPRGPPPRPATPRAAGHRQVPVSRAAGGRIADLGMTTTLLPQRGPAERKVGRARDLTVAPAESGQKAARSGPPVPGQAARKARVNIPAF